MVKTFKQFHESADDLQDFLEEATGKKKPSPNKKSAPAKKESTPRGKRFVAQDVLAVVQKHLTGLEIVQGKTEAETLSKTITQWTKQSHSVRAWGLMGRMIGHIEDQMGIKIDTSGINPATLKAMKNQSKHIKV